MAIHHDISILKASGITVEENCMEKFMALKQKGSKKMYNFIAMRINSGLTKIEVFEVGGLGRY